MSVASGREALQAYALLSHIYYLAGFDGCSTDKAAERALSFHNDGDAAARAWSRLEQRRKRHGWATMLNVCKANGASDKTAGRPFSPPVGARYSLEAIEKLSKL
jgi:hypothetical protein